MPHVTLHGLGEDLAGREPRLIKHLTNAVVSVYGEWARGSDVRLVGIPTGRWARGGAAVASAAPSVTFGMREEVFAREDAAGVVAELVSAFTEAVTAVFGDDCRDEVLVELVGQPCRTLLPNSVYAARVRSSLLRWVVRVRWMGVPVHHA